VKERDAFRTPPEKRFTNRDLCAYCAVSPSVPGKGDHVIPRCVFALPSDSAMRVPAYQACNVRKSREEDYVRDWLCAHIDTDLSAVPDNVYDGFLRSDKYGSSAVGRAAKQQGRYEPRFTLRGLYAGMALAFPLDANRLANAFGCITQGLYYAAHQRHFPGGGQFDIGYVERPHIEDQIALLQELGATGPYTLGGTQCAILLAAECGPTCSVVRALLAFYNDSVAVDVRYLKSLPRQDRFRPNYMDIDQKKSSADNEAKGNE